MASTGSPEIDLDSMLARVARWLPSQGPIKDFIHHNTLHAFQGLRFHEGVAAAARLYGARLLSGTFYRDRYRDGQISESALARALDRAFPEPAQRAVAHARMLEGPIEAPTFPGVVRAGVRAKWAERLDGAPLERRSHLHLFRLIGAYLDQGLASWRMPHAGELGFFDAVARHVRASAFPLRPFDTPLARELICLPAHEAIPRALSRTVGAAALYETYLLETLLAQPGWAGMVAECERKPESLLQRRRIHLLDYVAVTLVAELGCLEGELGREFAPLAMMRGLSATVQPGALSPRSADERLLSAWQDAFEWSYAEPLLGALSARTSRSTAEPTPASAWVLFCLDDRAASLRSHLEEVAPTVQTYGTAGYFGLDFVYCGAGDAVASKHCPAPIVPRHLVVESYDEGTQPAAADAPWWRRPVHLEEQSNTLFRGFLLSYTLGLGAAVRLAASVFRPSLAPVVVPPLSTVSGDARFKLVRTDDARSPDGLWFGYTVDELADRVLDVLRSIGVPERWPDLVVLFGHGSSSVNNPYFAAYNCGACSGRAGAPNARAFAKAANRPDVRAALRSRGLSIPASTWFVGALYDTTRDEATYFDLGRMPASHARAFDEFRASVEAAAMRNAAERCRRFATVPLGLSPAEALAEVRQRSVSLFEPRPEYNHATNAACVVGRRALTKDLFLDRRVFLNSYDPTQDPAGDVLVHVLAAVIPVCAGINLEYYFSRIDPLRYGAGTKLPHNVNGLLGVCNGIEGDLLTGLPTQMTDVHDPVRLLTIVEQTPEVALAAAQRNPSTFAWIEKEWIHYACVQPDTRQVSMYIDGRMLRLDNLPAPAARFASFLDAARGGRGNLTISRIARAAQEPAR